MKLSELTTLYRILRILIDAPEAEIEISNVTNDSRAVKQGTLFIAIKGANSDGHAYIPQAVAAGASAVVITDPKAEIPKDFPSALVTDSYFAHAVACEYLEGFPATELILGAVTGTNGKTTTVFLMQALIAATLGKCGLLSTVCTDNGVTRNAASHTTPSPETIQHLFRAMLGNGCRYAVMEQSSHGLDQHRTGTAQFATAVFTNLSGDHLDYHGTAENYANAKQRLFTEGLAKDGTAIINIDDPCGQRFAGKLKNRKVIGFGQSAEADWQIDNIAQSIDGTTFDLVIDEKRHRMQSQYIGEYNVMNLCGALAAVYSLGADLGQLIEIVNAKQLPEIPGRMERIGCPNGAVCFVDYAHTDDALARALTALRPLVKGQLIVIFGCGGDRDRTKRPRMGKVAAELADHAIITSDNPRSENPIDIIHEIKTGIGAPYAARITVESDRTKAIETGLKMLAPNDILLVAGKGHENYQEIRGERHHSDDREIIRRSL